MENMMQMENENEKIRLDSKVFALAKKFNSFYINKLNSGSHNPLIIGNYQVGFISPQMKILLANFPDVFIISESSIQLNQELKDYGRRSDAVAAVLLSFKENDLFLALKGWRNECYEVRPDFEEDSLMQIERAAACLFGIRQYGVDINGYINHPSKGLCVWLQRRSQTKQTWPGYFDNMVGGGVSVGYTVIETAHKESQEEASVPINLLSNLKPIGTVTIFYESERGLSPNTEYVFDLELPLDFVPVNQDGEVESFHLFTAAEALEAMLKPTFKTTSAPVLMDFLIRKGIINEDNEPNIAEVNHLLHIPLNTIYKKV